MHWADTLCCCSAVYSESLCCRSAADSMSNSTKVSLQIDHCTTTADASLMVTLSRAAVFAACAVHPVALVQEHCRDCGSWTHRRSDRTHRCDNCARRHREQLQQEAAPAAAAVAPPSSPSPPLSMFGRPSGCIDQLTTVERAAIVTLHGVGWTGRDIARELHCDEDAVTALR